MASKRKKPMNSYVLRVRSVVIEQYVVRADGLADAATRFLRGEADFVVEIDRPSIDILNVGPDDRASVALDDIRRARRALAGRPGA